MSENLQQTTRYAFLDVTRGVAICLMFIYHFCYDLDYFRFITEDFSYDPFWVTFRRVIVGLFLFVMGISLYLASRNRLNIQHYKRRMLFLLGYAALATISSLIMYPEYYIFFGILHFIAVASVVGLLFVRLGVVNLVLGMTIIAITLVYENPVFDQPLLQWIGLMTHLPKTVDYAPIFPWFGVVLVGIFVGQLLVKLPPRTPLLCWQATNTVSRYLSLAGRYSLHIYILHQPVFMGIIYIVYTIVS